MPRENRLEEWTEGATREVEWWAAKVYSRRSIRRDEGRIDLWERIESRTAASKYVAGDGPDTPFVVVKLTMETLTRRKPGPRGARNAGRRTPAAADD